MYEETTTLGDFSEVVKHTSYTVSSSGNYKLGNYNLGNYNLGTKDESFVACSFLVLHMLLEPGPLVLVNHTCRT